jgi:hypothetical protein
MARCSARFWFGFASAVHAIHRVPGMRGTALHYGRVIADKQS